MSRLRYVIVVVVGLLTVGVAGLPATAAEGTAGGAAPLRIMPLGDSITKDDGSGVPGAYRPRLWELAQRDGVPIDFVGSQSEGPEWLADKNHEAYGGNSIQDLERKIDPSLRRYRPDVILLHIGTNDMWKGDVPKAVRELAHLLDRIVALAPQARLYVASIVPQPQYEAAVLRYNSAIPGLVKSRSDHGARVYFVDMHSEVDYDDLHDGIHPTPGGYEKMAEKWWSVLKNAYVSARR